MANHEKGLEVLQAEDASVFRATLHPLHEAAIKLAGVGLGRSRTKDLIGLLLGHGARAWRQSQAPVAIHLHVASPDRQKPVVIKLR